MARAFVHCLGQRCRARLAHVRRAIMRNFRRDHHRGFHILFQYVLGYVDSGKWMGWVIIAHVRNMMMSCVSRNRAPTALFSSFLHVSAERQDKTKRTKTTMAHDIIAGTEKNRLFDTKRYYVILNPHPHPQQQQPQAVLQLYACPRDQSPSIQFAVSGNIRDCRDASSPLAFQITCLDISQHVPVRLRCCADSGAWKEKWRQHIETVRKLQLGRDLMDDQAYEVRS
jgi:hypothetical protein